MARLALLSLFLLVVAISAIAVSSALGPSSGRASDPAPLPREDRMPKTTRTIAYVALFLLMLGVVTGLFGGA